MLPQSQTAKQRVEPIHLPGHLVLRELQALEAGFAGELCVNGAIGHSE
jgi:hypothetical protein